MKTNVEAFCELFYIRGIRENENILIEAVRAIEVIWELKQKKIDMKDTDKDKEELFELMKNLSKKLNIGHFPGDKDFFYEIYKKSESLDLLKLLSQLYIYGNNGLLITPEYFVEYFKTLTKGSKNILVAECEKFAVGIKDLIDNEKKKEFVLTTENYTFYKVFETYFKDYKYVKVINQSIYTELLVKEKYDLIFSLPAIGMKSIIENRGNNNITDVSETIALENLLKFININGKLIIVLPAKFTFTGDKMKELRRYLLSNKLLRGISSLPEGIFKPFMAVKMNMFIFSNNNEKVKISETLLKYNKLVIGKSIDFSYNEFRKKDDWNVKIRLTENMPELIKFQDVSVKKVKLSEIAEVFRGKSILKDIVKPGDKYILNISNIEDGFVYLGDMDTTDDDERKLKRYQLVENDVLVTCRGTLNKTAIFPQTDKFVIASANVIVIRLKEKILSMYLKIFFESPTGKILIKSFQRGTTLMNINPNDLKEMEVPLLDMEKQEALIMKYTEGLSVYNKELERITKKWTDTKNEIFDGVI